MLKQALESRPSGIRLRIADTIGKNKSFISQITNPNYKTPLPEKYVEPIFDVIHATPAERERFLEIYRQAHPRSRAHPLEKQDQTGTRTLHLELPKLGSKALDQKVDALITDLVRQIHELIEQR